MKNLLLILLLSFVAAGCNRNATAELQAQNQQLEAQVEQLKSDQTKLENKINENPTPKSPVVSTKVSAPNPPLIDPSIKIEKCKTIATGIADNQARNDYLASFRAAQAAGDSQTAALYLELSSKPEHPMDYNSNYETAYLNCLNN